MLLSRVGFVKCNIWRSVMENFFSESIHIILYIWRGYDRTVWYVYSIHPEFCAYDLISDRISGYHQCVL